jgi:hypothetical protein
MPFLTLNGIPLQMAPSSGAKRAVHLGQYGRSYNGTPFSTVRTTKVDMPGTTTPMTKAEADTLERLLQGDGHVWSFDSVDYSSRGTPVLSSGGAGYTLSAGAPKFGTDALEVTNPDGFVRWSLAGDEWSWSAWTMMLWVWEGTWHHYARTSAGSYWKDGATIAAGSFPAWVTFIASILRVDADGSDRLVDDMVMLPYVVPSTWPAYVYGAGVAFGQLPMHAVGGDWLEGRCTQGLTRWESTEPVNGWGGGVGAVVSFELIGG